MNRRGIVAGLVASAALIGISSTVFYARSPKRKPAPQPVTVSVSQPIEVTLTGRVESRINIDAAAPIEGILDSWFVDVGKEVFKDQLIGRIRSAVLDEALHSAQAALDQAEANIAQLEAQGPALLLEVSRTAADKTRAQGDLDRLEKIYQRQKALMDVGATSRLAFEKSEKDYNAAKADAAMRGQAAKDAEEKSAQFTRDSENAQQVLTQQRDALEKAKAALIAADIHSPADGILTAVGVRIGEPINLSIRNLVTVATDLKMLQVVITPDAASLKKIYGGLPAFVRIADGPQNELPGRVCEIRNGQAIIDVDSPTAVAKLGSAQVRIKF